MVSGRVGKGDRFFGGTPVQYGDDDDGYYDESEAPLPSAGPPALLVGAGSAVGIGVALKRRFGRSLHLDLLPEN